MSKFTLPKRFDPKEASSGVWFDVNDEFDQSWGSFKCCLFDKTSPHYRIAHERWVRENKKELATGKLTGDALGFKIFVDIALLDWKGVLDEKGKEIPFSKKVAHEFFCDPEAFFVADAVSQKASDIRNFQGGLDQPNDEVTAPEPVATAEKEAKN